MGAYLGAYTVDLSRRSHIVLVLIVSLIVPITTNKM